MVNIKIVAGSTRPDRFNIQPATWIYNLAKARTDIHAELLDLIEINLPLLDEAAPPSLGKYTHEYTKKWSVAVKEADGFIFVTPEYNHSTSAALKNAIDYLFEEWNYKPVSFVSYGSLAGGSRAVEHLRGIAAEIKMYDLREQIMLPNYWEHLNDKGQYTFTDQQAKSAQAMLESLVFWAIRMKEAREALQSK